MQTLHVITNQQYLDQQRLPNKVVVVLDVLLATTTIAMALHHGAREVITVPEVEDAYAFQDSETLLAGEKDAAIPPGFETFAPARLSQHIKPDARLVLVSTNGTVALHNANKASHLYTGALVNATALTDHLLKNHSHETILLVCAASLHRFNIEDFIGAGVLVDQMVSQAPKRFNLTDAAVASRTLATTVDITKMMHDSRVGRLLHSMDLTEDIELSATLDCFNVVPKQLEDRIIAV
ncbi:MAG: 2-phosphosulfolactate phosphatase [Arenicellales bacterium]